MGSFLGGSAPAMARQIAEGYTLVSPVILKRLNVQQLDALEFELDKKLRETRGEQVDLDDQPAMQQRNRKISRIEGGLRVLRTHVMTRRRKGTL
jgi:hypothetical protein